MTASIDLTEQAIFTALAAFLASILPAGDAVFKGSISGTVLTVGTLQFGAIHEGDLLFNDNVLPGTRVGAQINSTTWNVSPSQQIPKSFFTTGVTIIQGQVSRVPELEESDFVVMTPPRRGRIETNLDEYADNLFTGSIADDTMTITEVIRGSLKLGSAIFGVDVADGTRVIRFLSGSGGIGTYLVSPAGQAIDAEELAAGERIMTEGTEIILQLDVHGPQGGDMSQIITTAFRDDIAADFFAAQGYDIAPLFAEDARQVPFPNKEQQWENRWIIETHMQANPKVTVPQQFAGEASVDLIEVEATYPL